MNNILASYFNPQQTIILIVVSVVGVLLIALNIILAYLFHKRGERKLFSKILQQQREMYLRQLNAMRSNSAFSEDTTPYKPFFNMGTAPVVTQPQEEPVEENDETLLVDEDQEIVDEVIINGIVMRYNRSFTARIIQASNELKSRYSELKNYILSYKGIKNKISWKKETFRQGRNTLATFVVRGKTLCLCLALNPKQFVDTKYKVMDLSIRSPKSKTPCMYRISNDRRVKYGKELIDMLFVENYLLEKIDRDPEDYMPPYETTDALIQRDLIRVVGTDDFSSKDKVSIEEEVIDTPVEEPSIEETEDDLSIDEVDDSETVEETLLNGIVVRYNKSFIARLSQASDEINLWYSELKNYMLSFKGVKNRISWKKESFRQRRNTLATFVVRGKSLRLCLAMNPKQFVDTKYKVIDLSIRSPKSKTPCMYRISSYRKVKYAKELIDILFNQQFHLDFKEQPNQDFTIPYEELEALIEKDLVRIIEKNDALLINDQELVVEASKEEVDLKEDNLEIVNDVVLEDSAILPDTYLEDEETDDVEEIDTNGQMVRYNRSYLAAIAQVPDHIKKLYSKLKNNILSYKGVKTRINWKRETFFLGKEAFACFIIRNKSLCLCLAMDPKRFSENDFKVIDLSLHSNRSNFPCMYQVLNEEALLNAIDMIQILLTEKVVEKVDKAETNFMMPYSSTEELIGKGLIRISVDSKNK